MRIVVDISVLFAGLYSRRGAAHAILQGCLGHLWMSVVTVPLAAEYKDVVHRPELRRGRCLTTKDLDAFLDGFLAASDLVQVYFFWRPNLRDEGDNLVLEAAVAGAASAIVTHNVRDFVGGNLRFDGIRIVTPGVHWRLP